MHRSTVARNARLLRQRWSDQTEISGVCLFCQHRSFTSCRARQEEPSNRVTNSERTRRENLSATQKTLLARDKALESIRGKLWKGTPPGADDPYTGESRPRPAVEEPASSPAARRNGMDEDLVMVGGENAAEMDEDVREYERRTAMEERERFQQAVDEAPSHRQYVPALRWEGLEVVGGEKEWDVGAGERPTKTFRSFIPKQRVTSPTLLSLAVHRAAVEVWYAHSIGRNPKRLRAAAPQDLKEMQGVAHEVIIEPNEHGSGVVLKFPTEGIREALSEQIDPRSTRRTFLDEMDDEELEEVTIAEEGTDVRASEENGRESQASPQAALRRIGGYWKHVDIGDPDIKFAIARRLTQLTGHTFPSHLLNNTQSLSSLHQHLLKVVQAPTTTYENMVGTDFAAQNPLSTTKPRVLDEIEPLLTGNDVIGPLEHEKAGSIGLLEGLKNVQVFGRRHTPIDREKQLGRWKVIERTLKERGLPVTGMGGTGGLQRLRPAHRS